MSARLTALICAAAGMILFLALARPGRRSTDVARSGAADIWLSTIGPFAGVAPEPHPPTGVEVGPVLVVFESYSCGYCAVFARTLDSLRNMFPTRLTIVVRSFTPGADQRTLRAYHGALCAGEQGRFAEYRRLMYALPTVAADRNGWFAIADSAGIGDRARFYGCVMTAKYDQRLTADTEAARDLGVSATPTFILAGELVVGTRPLAQLASAVQLIVSPVR